MAQQVWTAGIDVGKQRLDIALWSKTPQTLQVDRDAGGLATLIDWLHEHNVVRVGLEASGGYEREVLDRLDDAGFVTVLLNPRQVRQFARAKGKLAKNDRIDARTIAEFVAKMIDEDPARRDRSRDLLVEHLGFRRQILAWIDDCDNLLEHLRDPALRKAAEVQRKGFERDLARQDAKIAGLVASQARPACAKPKQLRFGEGRLGRNRAAAAHRARRRAGPGAYSDRFAARAGQAVRKGHRRVGRGRTVR